MSQTKPVSDFFHEYARGFDAIYGTENTPWNRFLNRCFRKSMVLRFQKTLEACEPIQDRSVLDIGCGPGHYCIALARRGANPVVGLDFAEGMLEVARQHARTAGVENRCTWIQGDFLQHPFERQSDYAIVMGFMDYIAEPAKLIAKVLSVTRRKAVFSFPLAGGLLAWQRQIRYRNRCPLFLYTLPEVTKLFTGATSERVSVETIARDLFVTVHLNG